MSKSPVAHLQSEQRTEHDEAQRCVNCGSTDCPRGERPCTHPLTAYEAVRSVYEGGSVVMAKIPPRLKHPAAYYCDNSAATRARS